MNAPEVGILGVSKSAMAPVYNKETKQFDARLMLPLSLSYDHRVIDGAQGARFVVELGQAFSDVCGLLLCFAIGMVIFDLIDLNGACGAHVLTYTLAPR